MLVASSRRAVLAVASRRSSAVRCLTSTTTTAASATARPSSRAVAELAAGAIGLWMVASSIAAEQSNSHNNCNDNNNKRALCAAKIPTSGDVFSIGKITKEPATGISFPELCNGMFLAGVGVRIKYVFVKVYAVGAYFDPIAMMAVKKGTIADMEQALLDPSYPRTIRIVMNRGLSVDKFINAIVEAVEPRLKGKNLDTLDEFKALFPKVDLVEGDEVEITIRGEMLLLKTALGAGTIKSQPFSAAMCDVYFGADPVSPVLKEEVLKGIPSL